MDSTFKLLMAKTASKRFINALMMCVYDAQNMNNIIHIDSNPH